MAQQTLSTTDAIRLFEALTGEHPQSANQVKAAYRVWIKQHHPDVTGPLSLESVQWMHAAYDVLKTHDWTKPTSQAPCADYAAPDCTDVRHPAGKSKQQWREQQRRKQWEEEQKRKRREEEQQRQRQAEEFKRRKDELERRSLWQSLLWGPDNLEYPGFLWCCLNLLIYIVGTVCSLSLTIFMSKMIIGSLSKIIFSGYPKAEPGDWFLATIIALAVIGFAQSGFLWLWKSFCNWSRKT